MDDSDSVRWLADSMTPLCSTFGDRLSLIRDRNCVQWSCDGHAAIVEFAAGDELRATFVSAPVLDEVTSLLVSAVYCPRPRSYRLTREGSARMVSDMMAFFSGVREPRFTFVNALEDSPRPV
jgi:hypothetical protein